MGFVDRFRNRKHRQAYRSMVKQWYADGGDDKFRFDYELGRESLVIDLGGYEGQWASDLYARHRCRILVFEPVTVFANAIRQRFRKNDDIEVFELALGARTRAATVNICGASSSEYKARKAEKQEIRIVDVRQWFDDNAIGEVALMKINIEGGEYELLERMIETELTRSIENIQIQFHNIAKDSARRMEAIQDRLRLTHKLTYQYRFVWENWARKTDG